MIPPPSNHNFCNFEINEELWAEIRKWVLRLFDIKDKVLFSLTLCYMGYIYRVSYLNFKRIFFNNIAIIYFSPTVSICHYFMMIILFSMTLSLMLLFMCYINTHITHINKYTYFVYDILESSRHQAVTKTGHL